MISDMKDNYVKYSCVTDHKVVDIVRDLIVTVH